MRYFSFIISVCKKGDLPFLQGAPQHAFSLDQANGWMMSDPSRFSFVSSHLKSRYEIEQLLSGSVLRGSLMQVT